MILNLDPQFTPFGSNNALEFESLVFPGGEPHIRILTPLSSKKVSISYRIDSFEKFGILFLAVDALKRMGCEEMELFLPYFPAARQDRVANSGEALSVKVMANLINSLGFNKVMILDPHSDVVSALINKVSILSNLAFIQKISNLFEEFPVFIAPDAGSHKKVNKLSVNLGGFPIVECTKSRNIQTGVLSDFKVYADDLKEQDCLIIDDICDGGGTFIGLAQALKAKNAGKIYLAVSHGIFSKGPEVLAEHFEKVFFTDSFPSSIEHPSFIQISLFDILQQA